MLNELVNKRLVYDGHSMKDNDGNYQCTSLYFFVILVSPTL